MTYQSFQNFAFRSRVLPVASGRDFLYHFYQWDFDPVVAVLPTLQTHCSLLNCRFDVSRAILTVPGHRDFGD